MEQLLIKAAVTAATDQGVFTAVISTGSMDREGDIVEPKAMAAALKQWADVSKLVPLAWAHQRGENDTIVGHIDPKTVRVEGNEVIASGWVDQSTDLGRQTWRLVKSGTLSFSFGYLIPEGGATKQAGGRFRIHKIDISEISVVPVGPANNDTRVLAFKAFDEEGAGEFPQDDELLVKAVWTTAYINDLPDSSFLYIESGGSKDSEGKTTPRSLRHFPVRDSSGAVDMPHLRNALSRIPQSNLPQSVKDRCIATAKRMMAATNKSVEVTDKEPASVRSVDPLRKQSDELALDVAMGQVKARPSKPATRPPDDDLRRRSRDLILSMLSKETQS